jgi:hypothetical protein
LAGLSFGDFNGEAPLGEISKWIEFLKDLTGE